MAPIFVTSLNRGIVTLNSIKLAKVLALNVLLLSKTITKKKVCHVPSLCRGGGGEGARMLNSMNPNPL